MSCTREPIVLTWLDYPIQHFLFPLQWLFFLFSCHRMLSNSNSSRPIAAKKTLLLLAAANGALMTLMTPQSLATFSPFYTSETFRRFYHLTKLSTVALSNVLSAVEIFTTLTLCVELGLRLRASPLSKVFDGRRRFALLTAAVVGVSVALNLYHFLIYDILVDYICGGEKMTAAVRLSGRLSGDAVRALNVVQAVVIVALPTLVVVASNARLARFLRRHKMTLALIECEGFFNKPDDDDDAALRNAILRRLPLISACFFVSHWLTFVPFLPDVLPMLRTPAFLYTIGIANHLLLWGKLIVLDLLRQLCTVVGSTSAFAHS